MTVSSVAEFEMRVATWFLFFWEGQQYLKVASEGIFDDKSFGVAPQ
jgi:hypothetical protein